MISSDTAPSTALLVVKFREDGVIVSSGKLAAATVEVDLVRCYYVSFRWAIYAPP